MNQDTMKEIFLRNVYSEATQTKISFADLLIIFCRMVLLSEYIMIQCCLTRAYELRLP